MFCSRTVVGGLVMPHPLSMPARARAKSAIPAFHVGVASSLSAPEPAKVVDQCLLLGVEQTDVLEEACNGQIRPWPVEAHAMETDMDAEHVKWKKVCTAARELRSNDARRARVRCAPRLTGIVFVIWIDASVWAGLISTIGMASITAGRAVSQSGVRSPSIVGSHSAIVGWMRTARCRTVQGALACMVSSTQWITSSPLAPKERVAQDLLGLGVDQQGGKTTLGLRSGPL